MFCQLKISLFFAKATEKTISKIRKYMTEFAVMPSMRFLWAAGPAADFDNTCIYNCAFGKINAVEAFAECLYILMCGTGYGFSVEQEEVEKLPEVPEIKSGQALAKVVIDDSKAGWADSVKTLMGSLYDGQNIYFDYSEIRPEGARLNTMGGRASGPQPLVKLHDFIRETMHNAQGRKLTTLEAHDICNQIAEIVVVGGVRRSSQISLSDLDDQDMRHAKEWPFPIKRAMANNSAIFREKPSAAQFLKEWASLALSGTGERGIFNLSAAQSRAPSRRYAPKIQGTNPCGEIMLRDMEFCNLSEVVVREDDDLDSLLDKVETATLTHWYSNDAVDGYVKLFYDALRGDQSHFVHSEEVLESWRIVEDLLCTGEKCPVRTVPYLYMGGNWGPTHKTDFITKWDYPA